jgi:hypothetical protein
MGNRLLNRQNIWLNHQMRLNNHLYTTGMEGVYITFIHGFAWLHQQDSVFFLVCLMTYPLVN